MSLLFYLTFIYLIIMVIYYFIYLKNISYDNLFVIILNFTFLCILPLYYSYFKENIFNFSLVLIIIYSLFISIALFISAFIFNLKIKEIFHTNKIFPLIYFLITFFILGVITLSLI